MAYGSALLAADAGRVGDVAALGVDEVLFARQGQWATQACARVPMIGPTGVCPCVRTWLVRVRRRVVCCGARTRWVRC